MSVYYVHSPELELLKIGYADNPHKRLQELRCTSPARLIMLAIEDGAREVEQARHQTFSALRVRGEWFRFEGALKLYVEALPPFQEPPKRSLPGVLGSWIIDHDHTLESFGKLIGSGAPTVSRICAGKMSPAAFVHQIYDVTNGEVDANDLFGLPLALLEDDSEKPVAATG